MTAQELIDGKYWQVSRRHGIFARLPVGTSPRDLLFDASMEQYRGRSDEAFWEREQRQWVNVLGDRACAAQFLRVYAKDTIDGIDDETIQEFHRLGGRTA